MSTIRSARTLAIACGALAVVPAPAVGQGLTSVPASSSLTPAGLQRLIDCAARERAAARSRRVLARPARVLELSRHGRALPAAGAPPSVRRLIRAANRIAHKPYVWGGGHGSWHAAGYDCSGSVGYALHAAGLLDTPVTSGALTSYGKPGKGRWVTIYANAGHTYIVVAGLRFDTTAYKQTGSRWTRDSRDHGGYVVRHPAAL